MNTQKEFSLCTVTIMQSSRRFMHHPVRATVHLPHY